MRFSVIIPAYNAEKSIVSAIESCLQQSFPPSEIIVIDDSSTDNTVALAEAFPHPVVVLRQPVNQGVAVARNCGVQASTGDWVALLDADDRFYPGKLEAQRRCVVETPDAVLIYTGAKMVSIDGRESTIFTVAARDLWPMLRYRNPIITSSVAIRRDAFDAVGGFDPSLRVAQDWDLWLRLAARYSVQRFAAVPEFLTWYLRVAKSLSSNPMRYFNIRLGIMENWGLQGLSGLSRFLCRQKILSFNYYDTAIALREEGSPLDLRFMLVSLAKWPLPWNEMPMRRYKLAAVMMKQHLFRSPMSKQAK